MLLIELLKQVKPAALPFRGQALGRKQIDDRVAGGAELRALISGGHEAVAPVRCATNRSAAVIGEHYIARQIFAFAAKPISDPGAHRRVARLDGAGIHLEKRGTVVVRD